MSVTTYDRAGPFLERAEALLLAREAENGLPLGVAYAVQRASAEAFFAVATNADDDVCAAALQTPPHGLFLTAGPDDALRELAHCAHVRSLRLPGVVGPERASRVFSEAWCKANGCTASVKFEQLCYATSAPRPPRDVDGCLRCAELGDVPFVASAIAGFAEELGIGPTELAQATRAATARIEAREIYVWEDGEPVSVAGLCRATPSGIAVNAVYTPLELRGRRYAQACVAATSQRALEEGKRFVSLYADRKNPISNRVYRNIGYEPLCAVLQLDFK